MSSNYQPTQEQLERWAKRDELEKYASAGIMSEEEQERRVEKFLDPNFYHHCLAQVRANKQKLLKNLEYLEQREQILLSEINRIETECSSSVH